jgi:Ca2+-transporting ATPase
MARPPRDRTQPLFSKARLAASAALGTLLLAAVFGLYLVLLRTGVPASAARASSLMALVCANLSVAGVLGVGGLRGLSGRQGPVYAGLVLVAGSLLAASVWAPGLARLFQFTAPGVGMALGSVGLGIGGGLAVGVAALLLEHRTVHPGGRASLRRAT